MSDLLTSKMQIAAQSKPRCVMFFDFEETAAPLIDEIHGLSISPSTVGAEVGNGLKVGDNTGSNINSGVIPGILDTESALIIASFTVKDNLNLSRGFGIGSTSTSQQGIFFSGGSMRLTSTAGDTSGITVGAIVDEDHVTIASLIDRSGGMHHAYKSINGATVAEVGTAESLGSWSAETIDQDMYFSLAANLDATVYYGMAMYKWTGSVPGDLLDGIQYAEDNWRSGTKTLYSGWD